MMRLDLIYSWLVLSVSFFGAIAVAAPPDAKRTLGAQQIQALDDFVRDAMHEPSLDLGKLEDLLPKILVARDDAGPALAYIADAMGQLAREAHFDESAGSGFRGKPSTALQTEPTRAIAPALDRKLSALSFVASGIIENHSYGFAAPLTAMARADLRLNLKLFSMAAVMHAAVVLPLLLKFMPDHATLQQAATFLTASLTAILAEANALKKYYMKPARRQRALEQQTANLHAAAKAALIKGFESALEHSTGKQLPRFVRNALRKRDFEPIEDYLKSLNEEATLASKRNTPSGGLRIENLPQRLRIKEGHPSHASRKDPDIADAEAQLEAAEEDCSIRRPVRRLLRNTAD